MQEDGNLVMYAGENNSNKYLWQSDTAGRGEYALFAANGEFGVVENSTRTTTTANSSSLVFSFSTRTGGSGEYLVCENTGNLAIYNSDKVMIWSTDTYQSLLYQSLLIINYELVKN